MIEFLKKIIEAKKFNRRIYDKSILDKLSDQITESFCVEKTDATRYAKYVIYCATIDKVEKKWFDECVLKMKNHSGLSQGEINEFVNLNEYALKNDGFEEVIEKMYFL